MGQRIHIAVLALLISVSAAASEPDSIHIRFLGTGAADWKRPAADGEFRRNSSILIDDAVLIDYTKSAGDMLPASSKAHIIFYTHSHSDHFDAAAALDLGIDTVYCSASWAPRCREKFETAASESGAACPVVIPLEQQQEVCAAGLTLKALPANHCTGHLDEQALIYLIIKGSKRVLYATDTGGIPANAAIGGLFGADGLAPENRIPLTALIMEATVGSGGEEDFRLFSHSCVETVLHTANVLYKTGCLIKEYPVYITHLARTLHPSHAELESTLPAPLKPAYDGLEVTY